METSWVFNEQGNVTRNFLIDGATQTFELRPPLMVDVEKLGIYAYNNPGNEVGTLMAAACQLLVAPKDLTIDDFRALDAEVGMEVVKGLKNFPTFDKAGATK